jgi:2-dehydro-3-deoxyphosphooctonate aldolase (KDO 8-P synthase)
MKEIGALKERLEDERNRRQLGQTEFARLLGITPQYYSMILSGQRSGTRKLVQIAKSLNVSVESLLCDPLPSKSESQSEPISCKVKVADFWLGGGELVMIAGPCVIESEGLTLEIARALKEYARELSLPLIFKASYDKANRTSLSSYRGPGLKKGLEILGRVKAEVGLPVLSDVHQVSEVAPAAEVLDVLQIPAFLCRQTDLIAAAAATGKVVNIKKGQFLAPWDMQPVVEKAVAAAGGAGRFFLTERGATFGYNNLVVDFRSLPILRGLGCPVILDVTHSVQLPGGRGTSSGGQREFIPALARAGVAMGVDGLFMEVHPDPDRALCDGPNSLPLQEVPALWRALKGLHEFLRGQNADM